MASANVVTLDYTASLEYKNGCFILGRAIIPKANIVACVSRPYGLIMGGGEWRFMLVGGHEIKIVTDTSGRLRPEEAHDIFVQLCDLLKNLYE